MAQSTTMVRVNEAISNMLKDMGEKFRGLDEGEILDEEDVEKACVQMVKQRITQRDASKANRDLIKRLKVEHPEMFEKE